MTRVMRMRCGVLLPPVRIHNAKLSVELSSQRKARSHTASAATPATSPLLKPPFLRRAATVIALGISFTTLGFVVMAAPTVEPLKALYNPPTDAETLTMFVPKELQEQEVFDYINNHPLAAELRSKPNFIESRPHLKLPEQFRSNSLTAGLLLGPNRVAVPPLVWAEKGGKSLVSISYLGNELCGHPGIVHGGMLATLLDEGLARCCFAALPHNIGMTASLNINYKAPAPASSYIVLRATTTKVEGRKAWVEGRIESLPAEGEKPVIFAEAIALFISPRQAAAMPKIYSPVEEKEK